MQHNKFNKNNNGFKNKVNKCNTECNTLLNQQIADLQGELM